MATTDSCGDGGFGPFVASSGCRDGFDFTVLFENAILNIAPTACFLLLLPIRLFQLAREPRQVRASKIRVVTLIVAALLAASQLAFVVLIARRQTIAQHVSLAGAVLDLVATLAVALLLDLEHVRSVRPSFLVSTYLFVTLLLDMARVRTAWLVPDRDAISGVLTTSLGLKMLLLALANAKKRVLLIRDAKSLSVEATSGPFSRALFTWLNRLLRQGYAAPLTGDALPPIHEKIASHDLSQRFSEGWARCDQGRQHALFWLIVNCLRREISSLTFPRLCLVGFSIAQPFLVGKVVTVLDQTEPISLYMGYGLIGATAIVFIGVAVSTAAYEHLGFRTTTMIRGGLMALAFEQMMSLPVAGTRESSAVSLMGADIEMLAEYFHSTVCESWANIIQLALATWLLQRMVVFTASSLGMGKVVSVRQKSWLDATERRINFTKAILGSIRNVKLLGLTEIMQDAMRNRRDGELTVSQRFRRVQTLRTCMVNFPHITGQLATFAAYAITAKLQGSDGFSVSQAITSLSLVNLLTTPLQSLLLAIPDTFAALGCLQRIQDFLEQPLYQDKRQLVQQQDDVSISSLKEADVRVSPVVPSRNNILLCLRDACFDWKPSPLEKAGTTLTLGASDVGSLIVVTGPVGSGKSTFLTGLAGEAPLIRGEVYVSDQDVALCTQTPWLAHSSVRENIVGPNRETKFDHKWYRRVVSACALDQDLARMPEGDETLVGNQGAKLSGGQKQRIAIARAIYARKKIACFDDVFSGLDNETARRVFHNVFGRAGLLRRPGCAAFLVSQRANHLAHADHIIEFGANGAVTEGRSCAGPQDFHGDSVEDRGDARNDIDTEEKLEHNSDNPLDSPNAEPSTPRSSNVTADPSVFKYYFSALGWQRLAVLAFVLVVESGIGGFRYIWVELWSSSSDGPSGSHLGYWLGIYGVLSVVEAGGIALAVYWTWVIIVPAASRNLHEAVLRACMGAPLSVLLSLDTGALMTRFSQDMRLVDMILPRGFIATAFHLFGALAQGAIAIASLPYLAATLPVLIGLLVVIQRLYLRTSRQLRLLDIELKSPLYTHFIESLAGLATIRAFSWTHSCETRLLALLDRAQKPYYLLLCIQRWLGLVLNLIVAAVTVLLVGLAVALRRQINSGLLGIALVMMMDLGQMLSLLIQNWTLLETSLGAIARIKDFARDMPCEEPDDAVAPPEWPSHGAISFVNANICWNETVVLREICLDIQPGEKVGLCGRTGSGKSSLVQSLLRLNEVTAGQILIDGHDITTVFPSALRQRIACLSQEPFLFPGSMRQNADPSGHVDTADLVNALRRVGVWDALRAATNSHQEDDALLNTELTPLMLSYGQQQLFCLARALMKKSKILILDEPTASLDRESDAAIQRLIKEAFGDCTVLVVAHRIPSLLDLDRIAVMDAGRLVEVGPPRALLARPDGFFSRLARSM
ncbi:uncharacterized protein LDX57_005003 [Aspergillus melleus]|uniref:uncharacterized protein n=1 Tax=Aspergillus melleus TaxID=138277 RepID=UPI001E8EC6E9|nr:uncharacterized protein LDX57_005003 [Aspergillus melleus]KAH8427289.1 hypothetical protein LDX57_005003 [Aspergillus melleus]